MTSSAPWWAASTGTLAGVVVTLLGNSLSNHFRRRATRADQWDMRTMELCSDFGYACDRLADLPVWPVERTEPPAATQPLMEAVNELHARVGFIAPQVRESAGTAATRAQRLADVIEEIRYETARGSHGALDESVRESYDRARRALVESVEAFATVARRELGIRGG